MHLTKLEKNIHIVPNKSITYYLNPDYIYLPLPKLYVSQNERVYKNQILAPGIVVPISGKVIGMQKKCKVNNQNVVVIANDYKELTKNHNKKKIEVTIENILKIVEPDSNLFGKFKSSKTYNNIVIYALNDNPYVYNQIYLLKEQIMEVLEWFDKLHLVYNSSNNYLVVKNNEVNIIEECLTHIGSFPNINLSLVNDEYLLEKSYVLNEKLKLKGETLFLSVEELLKLASLFQNNLNTTKLITISGDALEESKVIRLKIGTPLLDALNKYFTINTNNYDIIINGLMTGFILDKIDDFFIAKDTVSINIMKKNNHSQQKCIKCGACLTICPKHLNPLNLTKGKLCLNCHLCSYICPCHINLPKRSD